MWETGDTAAAEHNIAAWSQLTSPGLLHSSPHPPSPVSAVSTPPSNPRLFHQSCVWTVWTLAPCARQQARRRGPVHCAQCWTEAGGEQTCCTPHTVTPPGLETGAGTSSVIHIHLHTLTHTLVPAPPWLAAPPPAPPPPGCDTGRRKSEQEQQPVIISSYDGVSRGRGQIVT